MNTELPFPVGTGTLGYGDFMRFSKLVYDRFGLHFSERRRAELMRGVRQAFAASTCADLDEYYDLLNDNGGPSIHLERLVNALTISETHFFRNQAQFDALERRILPQIIQRRAHLRTLRIWSAGCSTGEEPYSIAMLLRDMLPDVDDWSITILGTDVNTRVLAKAKEAVYGHWAFREERAKLWEPRYFKRVGNRYELAPEVRRMVTFKGLNLAGAGYPSYNTNTMFMDLILCRNVMIYFSQSVTQAIVDRFYSSLINEGWLVVGHSEHSLVTFRKYKTHNFPGAITYQRTEEPTRLPDDWKWLTQQEMEMTRPLPKPAKPAAPPRVEPILKILRPAPDPIVDKPQHLVASIQNPKEDDNPIEQARELIAFGDTEQAQTILLGLVDQAVEKAEICALLGRTYADQGNWGTAETWCRQAIKENKLALEAYYNLALVLQHSERLEEAIEMMKKVVYIDRIYILGHFGLAGLYHSNGQIPHALKSLDNAARLLEKQSPEEIVSGTDGVTAGRLKEAVVNQGQKWSMEPAAGSP